MAAASVPIQRCKGCNAEIYWIKSMKGRAMPVDTKRVSIITADGHVVSGYTSHFSTCPKAEDFKKPAKEKPPAKLPNMDDTGLPPPIAKSVMEKARKSAAKPLPGLEE